MYDEITCNEIFSPKGYIEDVSFISGGELSIFF